MEWKKKKGNRFQLIVQSIENYIDNINYNNNVIDNINVEFKTPINLVETIFLYSDYFDINFYNFDNIFWFYKNKLDFPNNILINYKIEENYKTKYIENLIYIGVYDKNFIFYTKESYKVLIWFFKNNDPTDEALNMLRFIYLNGNCLIY